MADMSKVIEAKSDQMNADDLISGPITITITEVSINAGTEQPVAIRFEGDDNKPWKPCKTMSRALVAAWGADARKYEGRRATLYRDPNVTWGGMKVGGIRVSHLSHIEREMALALTATRGKKAITTIKPLAEEKPKQDKAKIVADALVKRLNEADDKEAILAEPKASEQIEWLEKNRPELAALVNEAAGIMRVEDDDDGPEM